MPIAYITFTTKEKIQIEFSDNTTNDDFKLEVIVGNGIHRTHGYLTEQQMLMLRDWLTEQLEER